MHIAKATETKNYEYAKLFLIYFNKIVASTGEK